jgi:hypothetical protein
MRSTSGRATAAVRGMAVALLALAISTPAVSQLGGIKKKLKAAAGSETAPADPSTAPAGAPGEAAGGRGGGRVVITPEVLDRLALAHKAREAERERAKTEDSPYNRYLRAQTAYEAAKSKCSAAQATFPQRMAADQKLMDKYTAMTEKMMAAMEKQDMKRYAAYGDSALAIMDPSCVVKQPTRPDDFNDQERIVEERAEKAAQKASGYTGYELGQAGDIVISLLADSPMFPRPADLSPGEKNAVAARADQLKAMYHVQDGAQGKSAAVRDTAPPIPPAAQAPAAQAPAAPRGATAYNDCVAKNVQKHEKEIEALGNRGEAARESGNTGLMMAIADSIMQLQNKGCNLGQ